jgi:hypothetical protein
VVCHFQRKKKGLYNCSSWFHFEKAPRMAVGRSIKRERERNGAQINASSIRSWRWRAKFLQVFFIFYHTRFIFCCFNPSFHPLISLPCLPPKFKFLGIESPSFLFLLFPMCRELDPTGTSKLYEYICVQTYLRVYLSIQCRKVISNKGQHKNPLVCVHWISFRIYISFALELCEISFFPAQAGGL